MIDRGENLITWKIYFEALRTENNNILVTEMDILMFLNHALLGYFMLCFSMMSGLWLGA